MVASSVICPCEAFAIGGTTSVRGYNDGAIGTGRKYVVERGGHVPITPMFTAAAFFDFGAALPLAVPSSVIPQERAQAR